jgi:hypothetical protein
MRPVFGPTAALILAALVAACQTSPDVLTPANLVQADTGEGSSDAASALDVLAITQHDVDAASDGSSGVDVAADTAVEPPVDTAAPIDSSSLDSSSTEDVDWLTDGGPLGDAEALTDATEPLEVATPLDAGSPEDTSAVPDVPAPSCPEGTSEVGDLCTTTCPVLVVGEGFGGTAAALAATDAGVSTCLVALNGWLGGQATTQGVSALDEFLPSGSAPHWSASYRAFRDGIRAHYLNTYSVLSPTNDLDGSDGAAFDPGSCWVSRLCYEPAVGASVLAAMLAPADADGRLRRFQGYRVTAVSRAGNTVTGVLLEHVASGVAVRLNATVTLDATELGDLLSLGGIPYRTGAEAIADTGEAHARAVAAPECVQPFTFPFVLERRPGGQNHLIAKPVGYDKSRYSLVAGRTYKVFSDSTGAAVFWTYRRMIAAANFDEPVHFPYDLAQINWGPDGNDFDAGCVGGVPSGCNLIDKTDAERAAILAAAEQVTLGYVYWLQHDAPRDDGTCCGYPNLRLRTDMFGTTNGLSPTPYIREARRLIATRTVVESDLVDDGSSPRARLFSDAVGTGYYFMDLHACPAGETTHTDPTWNGDTRPYQVPFGALVPATVDGLLAASKNLGATHLTNGAFRLHPVEWHIGEAAGTAAALAVQQGVQPRIFTSDHDRLQAMQDHLIRQRRMPIYWWSDLDPSDGAVWESANLLGVAGVLNGFPGDLTFRPSDLLERGWAAWAVIRLFGLPPVTDCHASFSDVPCSHATYGAVQRLADSNITSGCGAGLFCVDAAITRAQFATFLVRAAGWPIVTPASPSFTDVPPTDPLYGFVETAREHGVFEGDITTGAFGPTASLTRASMAVFSGNVLRSLW